MTNQINKNELLEGLNNNQKEAVLHKDGICLVSAGAGSGKTRVLTNRIANLIINENISSNNILSVTFTKKAGEEMKERLYKLNGEDNISDRIENINSFITLAEKFNNLDDFLKHIQKMINDANDNNSRSDKVKLMSIHKSKGLEFPIVFFIGVNDGLIPHAKSTNIEEERRIGYVAVSRPKKELNISWTMRYNNKLCCASIFIDDMIGKKKRLSLEKQYN